MHATIQKPIEEIVSYIRPGEKVFVVGCNNCAWKCHSGGEGETEKMAERLTRRGVEVVGYTVPGPQGMSLCKLDHTRKVLQEDYADQIAKADSFLVLGCGQGVHTVIDATDGGMVHPGCDTIFGGETVSAEDIEEYCSLCGECIIEFTGGLCPEKFPCRFIKYYFHRNFTSPGKILREDTGFNFTRHGIIPVFTGY